MLAVIGQHDVCFSYVSSLGLWITVTAKVFFLYIVISNTFLLNLEKDRAFSSNVWTVNYSFKKSSNLYIKSSFPVGREKPNEHIMYNVLLTVKVEDGRGKNLCNVYKFSIFELPLQPGVGRSP